MNSQKQFLHSGKYKCIFTLIFIVFLCELGHSQHMETIQNTHLSELKIAEGSFQSFIPPPSDFDPTVDRSASYNLELVGSWSAEATAAFDYAANLMAAELESPFPIWIRARYNPAMADGTLATAGPTQWFRNFQGAEYAGRWYPRALYMSIATSPADADTADIMVNINPDVDWYYGTDGNCPNDEFDFATVVLHEIGHGLGFSGSAWMNAAADTVMLAGVDGTSANIYDHFVTDWSAIPILFYVGDTANVQNMLVGDELSWFGQNGYEGNGYNRPDLWSPNPFEPGSSFSHLADDTYPIGNPNSLMTAYFGAGEVIHDYGPVALGMLEDMGWHLDNGCEQWYIPDVVGSGAAFQLCGPAAGYSVADQQCAQMVIDMDQTCMTTSWSTSCNQAYLSCIGGCTSAGACNYNPLAAVDDGSCLFDHYWLPDVYGAGPPIWTCTPPSGYHQAPDDICVEGIIESPITDFCADSWDGYCQGELNCCAGPFGCTDDTACNYDPTAVCNDGSCIAAGCVDPTACNYDPDPECVGGICYQQVWYIPNNVDLAPMVQACQPPGDPYILADQLCAQAIFDADPYCVNSMWDGICQLAYNQCVNPGWTGCTDPSACNYVLNAAIDDGSCAYAPGCTHSGACNFDPAAECDDGSCVFSLWYIPDDIVNGGPVITSCTPLAGYTLGDQDCVFQVISNDNYCQTTQWDNVCVQAYNCCLGNHGCDDPTAYNYEPLLCGDIGLCDYGGCTDSNACNYDPNTNFDDGSCMYVHGCSDPAACNYSPNVCEDGSCYYEQWYIPEAIGAGPIVFTCAPPAGYAIADQFCAQQVVDADPYCVNTAWDNVCSAAYNCCLGNYGCNDPVACNYRPDLCEDNSLCGYPGCTDPNACNFDTNAGCDDGLCTYPDGCNDPSACNFDPAITCADPSDCTYAGCIYPLACNYDPSAGCDNGSCDFNSCFGCTYPGALNYDPLAINDDGSCIIDYGSDCLGDLNEDTVINTLDLLTILGAFGTSCD